MKSINKIILMIAVSAICISCYKYKPLDYTVDKPENLVLQEDINSYAALKTFINRQTVPFFKLGGGVSLSEYLQKGVMYRLMNRNFDEIVAGYEMKHGAVVQSNGSLNLTRVEDFLREAKHAGVSVYGHTLCWHANQNATYLNSLIAPTIIPGSALPTWDIVTQANFETDAASNYEYTTNLQASFTSAGQGANNTGRALKLVNSAVLANDWNAQFFLKFSPAVQVGEKYRLSMDIRSDAPATFSTQAHISPGAYKHWDFFGSLSSTTQWSNYTKEITITSDMATSGAIAFNLGKNATAYYFDNITLRKYNEKGSGNAGFSYTFTNPTATSYWSAQVAHDITPGENGKEYTLKFMVKANAAGSIRAELQSTSDYSSNSFGTFAIGPTWQEYTLKTTTTAAGRNRFVISFGDFAGKVYLDNITLTAAGSSSSLIPNGDFESGAGAWVGWGNNSSRGISAEGEGYGGAQDQVIVKTPAQKDSIITAALENWIKGMLTVAKPYVTAWDVVNEPMSDWPDPSLLKTGIGKTLPADEFYWQDYLGKDYAVKAIKFARQYGNSKDTLFINDYGLESSLDKCRGLINYVSYVESKGVKVDGIGTQMHINTTNDKEKIAESFRLLAATGKLIKISELDIGVGVKTAQATPEHYKAQAEMYKYVIDKYFEIIPAAQRYGITIWSPLDSPASSSWRADEPIGIWTREYVRKLAYSYVADAIKQNAGK